MAEIKDILSELRQDKNLTQAQLAKIFHTSSSSISAFELGTRLPSIEILLEYVKVFDVSADYILGLSPYSDTLSSFHGEFAEGRTVADVIHSIGKLNAEQRKALLITIESICFHADISEKAVSSKGERK